MLSKESKIRVLENFYGVDYVLFGKPLKSVSNCCPIIKEEYVSIKGAMLSVYVEMLKLMDHMPDVLEEKVGSKGLMKLARENARNAREAAQKLVMTEKARNDIKTEVTEAFKLDKGINAAKLVREKIREKAFRLGVDNLLVARSLNEAINVEAMNDWTGKIVEDSYKILRDNLCEIAMMIIYDDTAK